MSLEDAHGQARGPLDIHYQHYKSRAYRNLGREPVIVGALIQFDDAFPEVYKVVEIAEQALPSSSTDNIHIVVNILAMIAPQETYVRSRVHRYLNETLFRDVHSGLLQRPFRYSSYSSADSLRFKISFKIEHPRVVKAITGSYEPWNGPYESPVSTFSPKRGPSLKLPAHLTGNAANSYHHFVECYTRAVTEARDRWIYEQYMRT